MRTFSDYREVMRELTVSLGKPVTNFAQSFRYVHIEGITADLVQLVGAVIDLDLDTILDISPTSTATKVLSIATLKRSLSILSITSM